MPNGNPFLPSRKRRTMDDDLSQSSADDSDLLRSAEREQAKKRLGIKTGSKPHEAEGIFGFSYLNTIEALQGNPPGKAAWRRLCS